MKNDRMECWNHEKDSFMFLHGVKSTFEMANPHQSNASFAHIFEICILTHIFFSRGSCLSCEPIKVPKIWSSSFSFSTTWPRLAMNRFKFYLFRVRSPFLWLVCLFMELPRCLLPLGHPTLHQLWLRSINWKSLIWSDTSRHASTAFNVRIRYFTTFRTLKFWFWFSFKNV